MLSTLALSVTGATYDAAKYIPAADVVSTGLGPCITRQQRVGWVVWTRDEMTGGLDVREATAEESIVEIERLRAADLVRRRAVDSDAAEIDFATFALDCHEYHAHIWVDDSTSLPPPFVESKGGAIGIIARV